MVKNTTQSTASVLSCIAFFTITTNAWAAPMSVELLESPAYNPTPQGYQTWKSESFTDSPNHDLLVAENIFAKPACIDADGDGWGWDGTDSCVVSATAEAYCFDTEPFNDGWGWNGAESCEVTPAQLVCVDSTPIGDGWGWNGVESCQISTLLQSQPTTINRRIQLLGNQDRIGFGADAVGGINEIYVHNFYELQSALESDWNYVILDPTLAGKEMGFKNPIYPGNNITLDGSLAPGLVMFPDYDAGFPAGNAMIVNTGIGGIGNKIFHSFTLEGRRTYPYDATSSSGNVGGITLREGTDYWINHVEITDFWDDAFISGIGNSKSADYITLSNVKVHNTDKGYQAFNQEAIQEGKGHITIFNSEWAASGRNPDNRGAESFHFFNNWVHSWRWMATNSGGRGHVASGLPSGSRTTDSVMLAESNVYESPSASNHCAERSDPTVNYGGWLYTDGQSIYSGHVTCGDPYHVGATELGGGPGKPNIPYSYWLKPANKVKQYVQLHAGPLR